MSMTRRVCVEIFRRPARHLIFLLIFTVSFVFFFVGLTLYQTSVSAKNQVLEIVGPYFCLYESDEDEGEFLIDDALREELLGLPNVIGINQSRAEYALACDFETVKKYDGAIPDTDPTLYEDVEGMTTSTVTLSMNWDVSLDDDFRLGDSVLLEGEYPTVENPGFLVEQSLAELNGLSVGDVITLNNGSDTTVIGNIVGIYETAGGFTITEENWVGEGVFAWSPYNCIYASLNFLESLYGWDISQMELDIYVDTLTNMSKVEYQIQNLSLDWQAYELENMTSSEYELMQQAGQIETLVNYSRLILVYTILIEIVVFMIVLNLFLQYYIADAAILIALGTAKRKIALQYLLSLGAIIVVGFGLSVIIAQSIINTIIERLVSSTTISWHVVSCFEDGLEHSASLELQRISVLGWGIFLVLVVFLLVMSALPLLWRLHRYHPRDIMAQEQG